MAISETEIANDALTDLGQETIMSRTDDNARARAVNAVLNSVRDKVLRVHRWNSAVKRSQLSKLSTGPVFGFTNAFQLPSDFLRLSSLDNLNLRFRIEHGVDGRVLVSDESAINLIYIARIIDVSQMDLGLTAAISARLAAEIALKLTGSRVVQREMEQKYLNVLSEAMFIDSLESPVETFEGTTWLNARLSGRGPFRKIEPV